MQRTPEIGCPSIGFRAGHGARRASSHMDAPKQAMRDDRTKSPRNVVLRPILGRFELNGRGDFDYSDGRTAGNLSYQGGGNGIRALPLIGSPLENRMPGPMHCWGNPGPSEEHTPSDQRKSGTGVLNVRCASFLPLFASKTRPTYSEFPPGAHASKHRSAAYARSGDSIVLHSVPCGVRSVRPKDSAPTTAKNIAICLNESFIGQS